MKEIKKIINLYLTLSTFKVFAGSLFVATYVIFFMQRGIDLFEISIIHLALYGSIFLFEIPTGVISDVFSRKISFVCSCFLMSIGMLIFAFANTLEYFVIAAIIYGIGIALESGSFEAWLVDSLDHKLYKNSDSVFAKVSLLTKTFAIFGVIFGAFLASENVMFPWILGSVIVLIVGILATIFMKEEYFKGGNNSVKENIVLTKRTMSRSIKCIKTNEAIRLLMVLVFVQSFVLAVIIQWQPLFKHYLQNQSSLGFISAGSFIAVGLGATVCLMIIPRENNSSGLFLSGSLRNIINKIAKKIDNNLYSKLQNKKNILIISQIVIGLGIFISGASNIFPIVLIAFLFYNFAEGIFNPISRGYLNENISKEERATLISFVSMTNSIGLSVGLIFSGIIAQQLSISIAWIISGGLLIISTLVITINERFKRQKT
ncbi:MAG: MFS transporter [Candidatus Andersenbacteria bacterium]|nr:MFS transporter [Candidatus Andersenbacteria bacterium]